MDTADTMSIFKLYIGEEDVYYDRRDTITDKTDYVLIIARDYDQAEEIAKNYLNKKCNNVEYQIEYYDTAGIIEGELAIEEEYAEDTE